MPGIFQPTIRIARVPLHAVLVPFPIVCFTGAMLTDYAYLRSGGVMQWSNFSAWLLAFGLIFGVAAALFGLLDFLLGGRARPRIGWFHFAGNAVVLLLAFFNSLVHARDGWTSVVPTGLTLSVITVVLLAVTGFLGHRMSYAYVGRERS